MALSRSFKDTVKARADRDPEFRVALLGEAVEAFAAGDADLGKALIRDYINATVGFDQLGEAVAMDPKNLMRMFGPRGIRALPISRRSFGSSIVVKRYILKSSPSVWPVDGLAAMRFRTLTVLMMLFMGLHFRTLSRQSRCQSKCFHSNWRTRAPGRE